MLRQRVVPRANFGTACYSQERRGWLRRCLGRAPPGAGGGTTARAGFPLIAPLVTFITWSHSQIVNEKGSDRC